MCGIVAATSKRDITEILLAGLHALEYRGYDSAGIAVINSDTIELRRTVGKVGALEQQLQHQPISGVCGIAHTRWATHGEPSEANSHPHLIDGHLALVHNGIIENHAELREQLRDQGIVTQSETDTEVIGHLIAGAMNHGADLITATQQILPVLNGSYSLAIMSSKEPGTVVGARHGSPLLLGVGFGEHFLASDIQALLAVTNRFITLDENETILINQSGWQLYDAQSQPVTRSISESELTKASTERGPYRHFMLKEIIEQPDALRRTLDGRITDTQLVEGLLGLDTDQLLENVQQVTIVACGTSYHAGLIARYQIEQLTGIPCSVEVASEYRYRNPVVPANSLFVAISQSGETADTLAALKQARQAGYLSTLAICNVPESSLVRASDRVLFTRAGPEIGVASTKAFTTQLASLQLLLLSLLHAKGDTSAVSGLINDLNRLPELVTNALQLEAQIEDLAERLVEKQHALFLGRGSHYPVAMEGALKLKEISYIHAEAYPAGELKHGPLALVDADMPVIAVAPNNQLLSKLLANLEEVRARGGDLLIIADHDVSNALSDARRNGIKVVTVEAGSNWIAPIVLTIPLQLLAYHVAVLKGTDVDQPRNLAKSVTVE